MYKKIRDSNIELLRLIAMILIIGHHYVQHGLFCSTINGNTVNLWKNGGGTARVVTSLLFPGGRVGNYIFFMLSGFFLIYRTERVKINKVVNIALFYGLTLSIITIILGIFGIQPTGLTYPKVIKNAISGIFSPVTNTWWFITAYITLILLSPTINAFVSKLTCKGYCILLLSLWLPFAVIDYMFNSPLIEIEMAVYFYLIGGYLRKSNLAKKYPSMIWAILSVIAWCCSAWLNYLANSGTSDITVLKVVAKLSTGLDAGITSLLAACFIFCTFANLKMCYSPLVNKFAESTLAVYLIHEFPTIRYFLWNDIFDVFVAYQSNYFLLYAIFSILIIFAGCIAIDQIRILLVQRYGDIIHNGLKEFIMKKGLLAQ